MQGESRAIFWVLFLQLGVYLQLAPRILFTKEGQIESKSMIESELTIATKERVTQK
jgi:hypothetical protein